MGEHGANYCLVGLDPLFTLQKWAKQLLDLAWLWQPQELAQLWWTLGCCQLDLGIDWPVNPLIQVDTTQFLWKPWQNTAIPCHPVPCVGMTCQLGGLGHGWRAMLLIQPVIMEHTKNWKVSAKHGMSSSTSVKIMELGFSKSKTANVSESTLLLGFLHYSHDGILIT